MIDTDWLTWLLFLVGYAICSGANVAYFAFSRRGLRRAIERGKDAPAVSLIARDARRASSLLRHLEQPNWTLAAILLTNVGFGVQLSQLSDRLFPGLLAVIMPIISITIVGEFFAQATFLRYAGGICAFFSPFVWLLKYVTSPVSRPLAWAVDALYGKEAIRRLSEQELLSDLQLELSEFGTGETRPHADTLDPRELRTLMNAAQADDEFVRDVGERLDPDTVIELPFEFGRPVFPDDPVAFVTEYIDRAAHPWFVIVNAATGRPDRLLDADGFVRGLFQRVRTNGINEFQPHLYAYRARVYDDQDTKVGDVISDLQVHQEHPDDDVIDMDVALIWANDKRWIVTGGDILGRLLRGVVRRRHWRFLRDSRRRTHGKTSAADDSA